MKRLPADDRNLHVFEQLDIVGFYLEYIFNHGLPNTCYGGLGDVDFVVETVARQAWRLTAAHPAAFAG